MATSLDVIHPLFFEAVHPAYGVGWRDLSKPFWRDGCLWATDGAILVRAEMPIDRLNGVRDAVNAVEFDPEARLRDVAPTYLDAVEAGRRSEHPVPDVAGWREARDWRPPGRVVVRAGEADEAAFNRYYLGLLRSHGVTMLAILDGPDGVNAPALFRGDGFGGMLAPVTFG